MEKDLYTVDERIFAENVKILYTHAKAAAPGSLLTGVCIFSALYQVIPKSTLVYWLLFVLIVTAIRYISCILYLRRPVAIKNARHWYGLFFVITLIGSVCWILAATVLLPSDPIYQILIAFAITTITAISVPLFSASRLINTVFIVLVLSSFGINMFLQNGVPYQFIALFTLIYMGVLILSSYRVNSEIRAMLKLQIENEDLIERLYTTKNEAEIINVELQTEISEREQVEKLLRNSEEQYRLVTDALPVLIAYIDTELYFRFNNKAYAEWFDMPLNDIIDRPIKDVLGESGFSTFKEHYHKLFAGQQVTYETTMQFHNNQERYVSISLIPHLRDNKIVGAFSLISDMTPRINYLATHDSLTNLPNRSLFNARLTHALSHAARQNTLVAILFLDLDHFKNVNDTLGHDVGDQLLVKVVERLKECVRENDTIARLGGDEFIIILEDEMSMERATAVAQRICKTLAQGFRIGDHDLYITTSVGISVFPDDGDNMQILLKNADMAMYRAKEHGRNTFEFYTRGMNETMQKKINIGTSLRAALEKNELKVYYQPIIDLRKNKINSMEALLRWDHPDMGFVSPGEFIPIAEETDLIVPIGEWVLRTASRQGFIWQREGYPACRMTVNISSRQFMKRDLAHTINRILQETELEGRYLSLELTESLIMVDVDHSIKVVKALKDLDIEIALDDFGAGYSSLSYLKRFPIDVIKIDRSFVTDFSVNQDDAAIVKAIIALGHNLKMKVVAKGVETPEQYLFLKQYGCDDIQGYLFYPPLSEFDATLAMQNRFALQDAYIKT